MTTNVIAPKKLLRPAAIDALFLGLMCLVPALSHWLAVPLYHADPMRWLLLAGMLMVTDKRNAYLLAVLLPATACLLTGMPTPVKALIIAAELSANVAFFHLYQGRMHTFAAMLLAILSSKVVYYLLKYIIIAPAALFSTQWYTQAIVVLLMAALFSFVATKQARQ